MSAPETTEELVRALQKRRARAGDLVARLDAHADALGDVIAVLGGAPESAMSERARRVVPESRRGRALVLAARFLARPLDLVLDEDDVGDVLERANRIARRESTHVWLTDEQWDVPLDERAPGDRPGAHTLCDACDAAAGPTHTALAMERSKMFRDELERRGVRCCDENGEGGDPIPEDLRALSWEAPEAFDDWPDALAIEHEAGCPVGMMLQIAQRFGPFRAGAGS